MPREIERKFLDPDLGAVRRSLQALGAEGQGPHVERNVVFDTPERALKARGVLLRLREAGAALLTLKRPPDTPGPAGFKVWEEVETVVADPAAMRAVLLGLGYVEAFCYEKVRETWLVGGVHVCLDRLPFGDVVELEGEAADIEALVPRVCLASARTSVQTYHDLNREFRARHGLAPAESFVFAQGEAERALAAWPARP